MPKCSGLVVFCLITRFRLCLGAVDHNISLMFLCTWAQWINCIVLNLTRTNRISPYCVSLHWLSIDSQTQYKLAFLHYAALTQLLLSTWLNFWKFINQPASYAVLLILPFFLSSLCAHTHTHTQLKHSPGQRSFFLLHCLSGAVFLLKLNCQTHSHLSNHLWTLTSSSYIDFVCVSVCVCMCVFLCACVFVCVCGGGAHTRWREILCWLFWFFAL